MEALFEAQPAVRDRVNGYKRAITAIEAEGSDLDYTEKEIEDSLQSKGGALVPDEEESSAIQADTRAIAK